ncbi:MAG: hypothetical protein MUO82_00495 [Candidatus Thermoplasmatota archaeon]|nr:hypothetical protein [Candidatus Thermoplasmatota archaeon]
MKKQLIIVGIIVILLTVGLSGCNEDNNSFQSDEEKIIGEWIYSLSIGEITVNMSYNFFSNKTLKIISFYNDEVSQVNGTWNIADNKLVITSEGETITSNYGFSNNDKTLTIAYGTVLLDLTKQ